MVLARVASGDLPRVAEWEEPATESVELVELVSGTESLEESEVRVDQV